MAEGAPDPSCSCGTGLCKRARIQDYRDRCPGGAVVYIGNGRVSDLCGAQAADVAFAKDSLAETMQARGFAFEAFETLRDVIPKLNALLGASKAEDSGMNPGKTPGKTPGKKG